MILRHCRLAVAEWGAEDPAIRAMRARLMAYSKGFPGSKVLREKFQHVSALSQVTAIAEEHLATTSAPVELSAAEV
jgi:tRNA-dihydrouridine synthase